MGDGRPGKHEECAGPRHSASSGAGGGVEGMGEMGGGKRHGEGAWDACMG